MLTRLILIIIISLPSLFNQQINNMPKWVTDRPIAEDRFYGVGEGKAMNPSLAKKMATAMARDELSQSIQIHELSINNPI